MKPEYISLLNALATSIAACSTLAATIATIGLVVYTARQVKKVQTQLEQTSATTLTQLSNQNNWDLFDRHGYLPPALPSWTDLNDSGWAWRVLHLNHLNLLKLAYYDHQKGLSTKQEFEGWKLKAKYFFRNLWTESPSPEIQQGREVLRQILRPEEGFPKEFRNWLVEAKIIPPDLISD